jgi:GntR family transcriptional regulator
MAAIGGTEQPLYQMIANDLRHRIQARDLLPGAQVPTEKELAVIYRCSRNTVRMALNALANEGLISVGRARAGRSVRRRDRFVLTHRVEDGVGGTRLRGPDGFTDQAHRQGRVPDESIEVTIVEADAELADRLEVPAGEKLVARRAIRTLDGANSHVAESFYPLALVHDTPLTEPDELVPSELPLLAAIGHRQVRFIDEITTRMPDPAEADELAIGIGVPVLEHVRTGYSVDRAVRLTRSVLPGDRFQLQYEVPC